MWGVYVECFENITYFSNKGKSHCSDSRKQSEAILPTPVFDDPMHSPVDKVDGNTNKDSLKQTQHNEKRQVKPSLIQSPILVHLSITRSSNCSSQWKDNLH